MSSGLTRLLNRLALAPSSLTSRCLPPLLVLPSRTLIADIYAYKTRSKLCKDGLENSLKWAEPLLAQATPTEGKAEEEGERHMLHLVHLIKTTRGRPWWEKEIVKKLMLEGKLHQPVIHKNIPSVNRLLFEIKHLVRVQPLRFPHGPPALEADWEHTCINSRGEMVVVQRLREFPVAADGSADPDPERDKWKLDPETVKKDLDRKMADYAVHEEYFHAQYKYRRNEDGRMYRYTFNKNNPKYEW